MIIIDPGSNPHKIVQHIEQYEGVSVLAILLTHGHFDHIGAVDKLYEKYHCPVYVSQDDEKMLRNAQYNTLANQSATISCPVNWLESDSLTIGDFNFNVYYTPGHTNGSVMFEIENNLFSGDTLFRLSVGRTDLYSGSSMKLMQSLQVLYQFDEDMVVYPGHDEITTVGFELANNPYLI